MNTIVLASRQGGFPTVRMARLTGRQVLAAIMCTPSPADFLAGKPNTDDVVKYVEVVVS